MRGSIYKYDKSAMKFAIIIINVHIKKIPCNKNKSLADIALKVNNPSPGHENIVSINILPVIICAHSKVIIVIMGSIAFFNACLRRTFLSSNPFALAVII